MNRYWSLFFMFFLVVLSSHLISQQNYTHADSLRGEISPERSWWDVLEYDLSIEVDIENKSLKGINKITATALSDGQIMQIDLQPPMKLTKVTCGKKSYIWISDGNAHFIDLGETIEKEQKIEIDLEFEGKPIASHNPPWDGGLIWEMDEFDSPFIATACQGKGASLWWPCKDHPYDEVNKMTISIVVPDHLTGVSNGRLIKERNLKDNKKLYKWKVVNPINNYGVTMNIANYVHLEQEYAGMNGILTLDYFVLPYRKEQAKQQFQEVPRMLEAFEYWLGPYPFYKDGYKLVEVPYLGMEHQSAISYGNQYKNGYLGRDRSLTGMGLLFDFIIVHESAHEWFANNVTAADNADVWIHESFAHYAESLFLEYFYGKDTAYQYIRGVRSKIKNDRPIQGSYGVNSPGSVDMYYKGANALHTLRQIVDNDSIWRAVLIDLNTTLRHQTIDAETVMDRIELVTEFSTNDFFNQYFQTTQIPVFTYRVFPGGVRYKWEQCIDNFQMPIDMWIDDRKVRLDCTTNWKTYSKSDIQSCKVDVNYYVATMRLN